MSKKVTEEIDLNCDAAPVDRENEGNDVNVGEAASGAATSLIVDQVKDSGEGKKLGKESIMESVRNHGFDLEADVGSLGRDDGGKVGASSSSGGTSSMEVDGGSRGCGDGEGVSMEDKKAVGNEQMAMRSSGGVSEDLNVSVCPKEDAVIEGSSVSIRSSLIADDTIQSEIVRDSDSGDRKPLPSAFGPENSLTCGDQNVSSKEGSSGGLKGQDMEIDIPDDTNKNKTTAIQAENDEVFQNAENGSNQLNDDVDSNPCTSTDEDPSGDGDVDTKVEESEFCVSDLVWGKVRSHPWWPGQIFDRSDATSKAKKYIKKDCCLIAYFGDQTFAWNEVSRIKPFRPHFSHMEKQTNMEEFHYAIDCALDEVSRRVEFGLACSCISKEANAQVKTQIILNAGIREESSRKDGGDRFSTAASFYPLELVKRIKALAQSPSYSEVDRLQLVTSQAQLLAFHRWKGYCQLPEFQNLFGLLETDAEEPLFEKVEECSKLIGNDVPSVNADKDKQVFSEREKPENQDESSNKQKKIPGDAKVSRKKETSLSEPENQDGSSNKQKKIPGDAKVSSKKETSLSEPENQDVSSLEQKIIPRDAKVSIKREKSLSELMAERRLNMQNAKKKLNKKVGDELISSSPAKKLKADGCVQGDSATKQNKSNTLTGSLDKSLQSKQTFRVGASILRVASQMNGSGSTISGPALKHDDGTSEKSAVNKKSKGKSSPGKSPGKKVFQMNMSCPDEMLAQLYLAATDPLKGYSFLDLVTFFFTELRNSIAMDPSSSEMSEQSSEQETDGKKVVKSTRSKITGKSKLTSIKDSCCSDRIIKCLPEEQSPVDKHNQTTEVSPNTPSGKGFSVVESKLAVEASPDMDYEQKCTVTDENPAMEAEKRVAYSDESCREDQSPTALILKFSNLDSVPSVEELNKIFSSYGPLVASGAEVLKKSCQAKVVYKRCADAETAFSSSGKYSIFGPSLVSYRLKRLASSPAKSSPGTSKRCRVDEACDPAT